jgi:hypothetical protein
VQKSREGRGKEEEEEEERERERETKRDVALEEMPIFQLLL